MPPRARKSTDAKPESDELPLGEEQAASAGSEGQPTAPEAEPAAEPVDAHAAAPEPTYHWMSVNGDGSEPCRHCPPGTPPTGAGSYGCPHGQWVRIQDTTP